MLDNVTPVILSSNEEDNISRTLDRLGWANDIVVVDSFSTDNTPLLARARPHVRLFQRVFDNHANQWTFAIQETAIKTEWVLALDADYVLTNEFTRALAELKPDADVDGYWVEFVYCIRGKPLRGTLYPPVTVLFRREKGTYVQEGHTQRVRVNGRIAGLRAKILHDDRKSLSRWLAAQDNYMNLEAQVIARANWSELGMADRCRRLPLVAPFLAFAYCYIAKGIMLDGRAGLYYALQRLLAESLLSLRVLEKRMALREPRPKKVSED